MIFGASHGGAIGDSLWKELPVGFAIDMDTLNAFLTRRAPGRGRLLPRGAGDAPLFLSGVKGGVTCGGAVQRSWQRRPSAIIDALPTLRLRLLVYRP